MDNKQVQESISKFLSELNQLEHDCKEKTKALYHQIKAIEDTFNQKIKLINKQFEETKEIYYPFAFDLAIEKQKAPKTRSGSYMTPDEVSVDEEGIHLSWCDYNPQGSDHYDYFSASWDEVLEFQKRTVDI